VPSYVLGEAPPPSSGLVEVAGGDGLPIGTTGARLLVAGLAPGASVALPDDRRQHVFAATGAASLAGLDLRAGDAVRLADEPGHVVTATAPTELLVWSFSA
jgi:hypothetical protein